MQVVPTDGLPDFGKLGLPRRLVDALARKQIAAPFPIQAATIPDVLTGRDLLGRAATGSGKTLAFGLPLIVRLQGSSATPRRPRGLVLVPTRELAMQVTDAIAPLAAACGVATRLVAGGLPIGKQIEALARGVDILVATPGRLLDLIDRRACSLDAIEVTVVDEADHMSDLGFLPVVRRLLDQTPPDGQRLLFSATLDGDVATLVEHYLSEPAVHALATPTASIATMSHHMIRVRAEEKTEVTASIAARGGRTILFVRTKHGADRVAKNLARAGIAAGALHGGLTQSRRNRALEAFRAGTCPVLVATDVAARGIHVDDISLVVHVDPPQDGKTYLHRSGRTARAGESGVVLTLVTPADERAVRRLLSEAGVQPVQRDVRPNDESLEQLIGPLRPASDPPAESQVRPATPPGRPRPASASHARPRRAPGSEARSRHGSGSEARARRASGAASQRSKATQQARDPQHRERRPRVKRG